MSAAGETITVLDFDAGKTRRVSMDEWLRKRDDGCRRAGHIFAYRGQHLPEPPVGTPCMCGDVTWPPSGAAR